MIALLLAAYAFLTAQSTASLNPAQPLLTPANQIIEPSDTLHRVSMLAMEAMDDSMDTRFVRAPRYRGAFSLRCDRQEIPACAVQLDTTSFRRGDYLRVRVMAFFYPEDMITDRRRMAQLWVEVPCSDRELVRNVRITPRLGNRDGRYSFPGLPGRWLEAAFFVELPPTVLPEAEIRAYITNAAGQRLFIDDLAIELWRY